MNGRQLLLVLLFFVVGTAVGGIIATRTPALLAGIVTAVSLMLACGLAWWLLRQSS